MEFLLIYTYLEGFNYCFVQICGLTLDASEENMALLFLATIQALCVMFLVSVN